MEEFQWHANHQDQRSNAESITKQYGTNTYTKEKMRTINLTRFDNLFASSEQKGEDLIQPT